MFGTLYEPPSLSLQGLFILFIVQIAAIFVYKQAQSYYRDRQDYAYYAAMNLSKSVAPTATPGPPGPANRLP